MSRIQGRSVLTTRGVDRAVVVNFQIGRSAVGWGLVHLIISTLVYRSIHRSQFDVLLNSDYYILLLAMAVGVALVGLVSAVLFLEFYLYTPAFMVYLLFMVAAVADLLPALRPTVSHTPAYFEIYLVFWPVLLLLQVVVASIEHTVRRRVDDKPLGPSGS